MLTCKEQVALSSDFIDDGLGFRQRMQVRYHLLFCPACRRFIRQMRLMSAALRVLPDAPPADLDEITERLVRERSRGKD